MFFGQFNNAAIRNTNNSTNTVPQPIMGQQPANYHEQDHQVAPSLGAAPTIINHPNYQLRPQPTSEKRQPHGGAKSHKLLDSPSFRNLFVARLPKSLGDDDLLALFADFSPQSAVVMMDMVSGKSKGYGFVTFASEEEGQVACEAMSARTFAGPFTTISYTLELKPSTYNGQRIVVESRYVYFRNFPAQLFVADSQDVQAPICFDQVRTFLGNFGEVLDITFQHKDGVPATTQAPLLVSFATQAEAQLAITGCHGKLLFPHWSATPAMAKYADMTTVKAMDKQHRRRPSNRSLTSSASASVSSGIVTPSAAGAARPTDMEHLPYPALANRAPILVGRGRNSGPTGAPLRRGSGGSSGGMLVPSRSSGSFSGPQSPLHGRSPPVVDFLSPNLPSSSDGAPQHHASSSNVSSSGRGSQGGSSSSFRSRGHQHRRAGSALGSYRNDPYNQAGYVVMSSSSSQSSSGRLSTRSGSSDVGTFHQD